MALVTPYPITTPDGSQTVSLDDFATWLSAQSVVAIDTETTGLNAYGSRSTGDPNRIIGVSFAAGPSGSESFYLPFRHERCFAWDDSYELGLLSESVLRFLMSYLSGRVADGSLRLILWNARFDLHMMSQDGFVPPVSGGVADVMLAAHLLNENEPSFGLKQFTDKYRIGVGSLDEAALFAYAKRTLHNPDGSDLSLSDVKGRLAKLPADVVAPYAESDTTLTWLVSEFATPALASWDLSTLYDEVNDYNLLLWRMENAGVRIDRERAADQIRKAGPLKSAAYDRLLGIVETKTGSRLSPIVKPEHTERVSEKTGRPLKVKAREEFNPKSAPQVTELTGWESSDVRFIEELADDDPWKAFGEALLDFRIQEKMTRTYYDAYLDLVDADGTLRPNYNLHGTVTGRLSCSKPNLQNVPRYTPKRPVKEVFVARDGYELLEMDFQAAELRIATHYADERKMRDIILEGRDAHSETASSLGVERFVAKTMNFLVIYGGGVRAITKLLKCEEKVAKEYLDGYNALYPGFQRLSQACEAEVRRTGFIRLPSGRIRHFLVNGVPAYRKYPSEAAPRKAMNSLIQGTSSEMLRIGMTRFDRAVRERGWDVRLLLQVHDSLMVESPPALRDDVVRLLRETMTDFAFNPPPAIEVKYGSRWAPMTEYEG